MTSIKTHSDQTLYPMPGTDPNVAAPIAIGLELNAHEDPSVQYVWCGDRRESGGVASGGASS
jgi:hypothetical protein